jgi:Flp pilus assembly protein TadD
VEELYTTRMLGLSYLQRNQLAEAEVEFKKLTDLAPDDPLGYADLGLTYLQAARYEDAEEQLDRARELDPGSVEVRLALARLYSLTQRPAEARAELEALRRDTTAHARVLYALAELDARQGDAAAAGRYEERLRDVLAIAPGNLAVRLKLIEALAGRGQADSAVRHLEEVRRVPPAPPAEAQVALERSIQLLRAGDTAQSRPTLDRVLRLMEGTAPYQASLDDVRWIEGPIPGRVIITFAPKSFVSVH